jgi:sulfur-oxidizing protein SoxZ
MSFQTRIVMPATAKKDETVQIKSIIQHPMETGYRRDHRGEVIARDIIKRFVVTYLNAEVFTADTTQGIASNPFFGFNLKATDTGDVVFTWTDEKGVTTEQTRRLTVS